MSTNPRFKWAIILFVVYSAVCAGITIYSWNLTPSEELSSTNLWIMRIVMSAVCVFVLFLNIASCEVVEENEIALISLFGKRLFQVSGCFIYAPFCSVVKETKLPIAEQFPSESERKSHPPSLIVVVHGAPDSASSDPLDNRITTTASIICRYKIVDLLAFTNAGGREHFRPFLKDLLIGTLRAECSSATVGKNIRRLPQINDAMKKSTASLAERSGLEVLSVSVDSLDWGGAINDALQSIPVSIINMEVNRNNAQKRYFEGLAEAEVHKAFQFAKAEGYKAIAKELGVTEPVVLYQVETLANMWRKNNADVNLYAGDMGDVFRMITTFAKLSKEQA